MKLLLSLYFFILAIIQAVLLAGIYQYYRSKNTIKPSIYWLGSLAASIFALTLFGVGILSVDDIARPRFNFTVANTFFFLAAALQAYFCRSLNHAMTRSAQIALLISTLLFFIIFEILRNTGTFEIRTVFVALVFSVFYVWQITEIRKKRLQGPSIQLHYLQNISIVELLFNLGRLSVMMLSVMTIREVDQIPQLLILVTLGQLVMTTLAYIVIGAYWTELIVSANYDSELENKKIKSLLQEREVLIGTLLKANKTVATGALSASIAHELNQPLAATSLNIQFLQKKLSDGGLSPEIQENVYEMLLKDNQRSANIIQSLKGIFSDQKVGLERFSFAELMTSINSILRPELRDQNIELKLDLAPDLSLHGSRDEIQQVMLNLIGNAIQVLSTSNQSSKIIVVSGNYHDDEIEISVADNGPGVSTASQESLFELLTDSKSKGMGLGLWLCKHIVTRHGGKISYRQSTDGGAKFIMQFPRMSSHNQSDS